jgi:methionyl-tRNA formyltransferase
VKLVFMGTPQFAVPTLEKIVAAGHDVAAVFTQPDRPKGRGRELAMPPVKEAALGSGLNVRQPERIRRPEAIAELAAIGADAMVVVGYGQIIPQAIIDLPRFGIINVHASLLPKYRGAAPVQWAIANGETLTGVTTMQIDAGLDTGAMLLKAETPIGPGENALDVGARLSVLGADLLVETLCRVEAGTVNPEPQDNSQATYAPVLKKEDGLIDWTRRAETIYNRCRGFLPWPGVYTTFRGQLLHIWRSKPVNDIDLGVFGSVHADGRRLMVACGRNTALEIEELQLEGRKRITAAAFLNGQRLAENETLGENKN